MSQFKAGSRKSRGPIHIWGQMLSWGLDRNAVHVLLGLELVFNYGNYGNYVILAICDSALTLSAVQRSVEVERAFPLPLPDPLN
jgi:hypothetical protein